MADAAYLGVIELFPVVVRGRVESIVIRVLDDDGRECHRDVQHRRDHQTGLSLLMETAGLVRHVLGERMR